MSKYREAKRLREEDDSIGLIERLEKNGNFVHADYRAARAMHPEQEDGTPIRDILWIDFRDGRYGYLARDEKGDLIDDGEEFQVDTGKLDTFYIRVGDRRWRFPGKVEVTADMTEEHDG